MISNAGSSLSRFMLDTRRIGTKYSVVGSKMSTMGSHLFGKTASIMEPEMAALFKSCVDLRSALEKLEAQVLKFREASTEMCTSAGELADVCRDLSEGDAVSSVDTDLYRAAIHGIAATSGESEPPTSFDILLDGLGKVLEQILAQMRQVKLCVSTLQRREVMKDDLRGLEKEVAFMKEHTYTAEETDAKSEALADAREEFEKVSVSVTREAQNLQANANRTIHDLFEQFRQCQLRMFSAAALSLGDTVDGNNGARFARNQTSA